MPSNAKKANTLFIYNGEGEVPEDVKSVEFAPSVTEVPPRAFQRCHALNYLVLNERLQRIGDYAFQGCQSLESIKLPSNVREIGEGAFGECITLTDVLLNEGLSTIGAYAFEECVFLESIKLPPNVRSIEEGVFLGCISLHNVLLDEGLQRIGSRSFQGCISLATIKLPSNVIEIGHCAFLDCRILSNLLLNDGLQRIGLEAFKGCDSLQYAKLPSVPVRLESIGDGGRANILQKIQEVQGVEMVGGELLISVAAMEHWDGWGGTGRAKNGLEKILDLITYYEATTVFELALWKSKIMEDSTMGTAKRDTCRIEVPGPFKESVAQFSSHNQLDQSAELSNWEVESLLSESESLRFEPLPF
mmetsp:Transcript_10847/g.18989  ORF Transcript_10847/g.18989 Transcript_10847/m.18989 type:complete len:360 (-) Transcript_10847:207-1286(-)|eukprot:CAMPEP_0183732052 /NCGR_PEP_ID=MMETSP0737-20130205/37354_1 /TAXON_ID=385413 /ORGANISM="Thalassiosira miniscula, Strain CCMP1093" /LENGTH=359 /DNA_ID=CAMNT_0025964955 /DNA_START=282 /DNA_END=1361 /DNA_ORIENTATION=+